jgi:nickel-dependent lactate racemase
MIFLPYGNKTIELDLSNQEFTVFQPELIKPSTDQTIIIENALKEGIKDHLNLKNIGKKRVAVAINDQSRPLPNNILLPVLLKHLNNIGIAQENITFFIATGTHTPLKPDEFSLILSNEILSNYRVVSHDCDDLQNLINIGKTTSGTPIQINRSFMSSDIKILVGNIESHHFMGFSGGVKTAAIGLTGRETITVNHSMLTHPNTTMGLFSSNPMRKDVEEIGKMIGIDFVLNIVINDEKEVIAAFSGDPVEVISKGIDFIRKNVQMEFHENAEKHDLVIASPGGYPKDINFYQAQKAITHACLFSKQGGVIILAAECRDGMGSMKFEQFINAKSSFPEIIESFISMPFEIGPHKAFQLAKQAINHKIILVSDIPVDQVQKMHLLSAKSLQEAVDLAKISMPQNPRIAVLPYATHTMPKILEVF